MAKKSQRRVVRYERDKSGCMWGFISMFDFRHGHPTRKMIADKRRSSKHSVGGHSNNRFEMLSNLDEVSQGNFDSGESKRPTVTSAAHKPSVKKLIEEEMFIDQNAMKDTDNAETESKDSRIRREVLLKLDSKRKKKSSNKSRDMDTNDLNLDATLESEISHNKHSRKQSKDDIDLDKIIEEFCCLKDACSKMDGNDGKVGVHAQSNQKHAISENKARDAIRELVNQMILNGKDMEEARKLLCSHELMEALQLISSDKELLLTFLQNPNSLLLKCLQEFGNSEGENDKEHSCITASYFSDKDHGNPEQTREIVNHKKHNFFRKKVKSQSKSSTNDNGNSDMSNRIVILKPGSMDLQNSEAGNNLALSLDTHDTVKCNGPSVRGSSHFSLSEIKKKLKHAMGRDKHGSPEEISKRYPAEGKNKRPSGKAIGKDNAGIRSPNKDHFFIEKIARPSAGVLKGDKTGIVKDSELTVEHENGIYPKQRASNLYIEAKKHLCEMVDNRDEKIDLSSRQISKTLGRMLSLPEYNFSPLGSPGRDWENYFVTAQRRFSTSDRISEANKDNLSSKQAIGHLDLETANLETQSDICDESSNNKVEENKSDFNISDDLSHVEKAESHCAIRDEIVIEGDVESATEINIIESSSEEVSLSAGKEDQNYDISENPDSTRCSQCLKQDVTEENKPSSSLSSPPHSSITKKTVEIESVTDASARPSPVSVLDIPFLEDDASLGHSRFQPVEVSVQPLHIQFEEQDSSPVSQINRGKYCLEEGELIYDFIKAILQASGLTRDQLWMKCLSSDKILDPSLFDQVEFSSNQPCHDKKLLYDCINEVLVEICWHYFGISPCVSFVNPSIRLITPNMNKVILKVWEGLRWHLLPLPPPRTLDKIVRKEMEKTGSWMDLQFEAETVGFEMGEAILAELMEETVLSCVSKSPLSDDSQLQIELEDNKNSTV